MSRTTRTISQNAEAIRAVGVPEAVLAQIGVVMPHAPSTSVGLGYGVRGVVGARMDLRYLGEGVEVAGGLRGAGAHRAGGSAEHDVVPAGELRSHVERWLSPFLGLGVQGGASVVERGAWSTSFYVTIHTTAFAGLR